MKRITATKEAVEAYLQNCRQNGKCPDWDIFDLSDADLFDDSLGSADLFDDSLDSADLFDGSLSESEIREAILEHVKRHRTNLRRLIT